jgi:uncharacterized alkaline shock family protein YloU
MVGAMPENREYITSRGEHGSVNISEDVVAFIAGNAAMNVDGVDSLFSSPGKEIADIIGKKGRGKGVRIRLEDRSVEVDVFILAEMDKLISEVGAAVQSAVVNAVESSVGIGVSAVNVHVCGIAIKGRKAPPERKDKRI